MTNHTDNRKNESQFTLGQVCYTPGAENILEICQISPFSLLKRHQQGDWGDLDPEDIQANIDALLNGARIFSSYILSIEEDSDSSRSVKIWIITEADRSVTTLLLPEEY